MRAALVMFTPDGKRRDFDLKTGRKYTIGRKDTCDLRIPLTAVSREHAVVYFDDEDNEFVIEDLDSSNGTFVNSERVTISGLCPGDVVLVGPIPLQVVINGHPKVVKPLKALETEPAKKKPAKQQPPTDSNPTAPADESTDDGDEVDLSKELMAEAKVEDMPDESDSFFAVNIDDE
jgi:pSer/pThr/pTyr-binding forkhead associated (FHA) protein